MTEITGSFRELFRHTSPPPLFSLLIGYHISRGEGKWGARARWALVIFGDRTLAAGVPRNPGGSPTHAQHKTATIWECWLELVHPGTDLSQIAVELSIIEGPQFHPHDVCFSHHPSGQSKEREQPLPRRVSIGGGEVVVTAPHHQIGQRDFAHRHDLILAVIQFVHRSLCSLQIFQQTEDVSLLFAVPLLLAELLIALLKGPPHLGSELF